VFFPCGGPEKRLAFSIWEKRAGYDILIGKVEKILVPMNKFGKSARWAAYGFAVDFFSCPEDLLKYPSLKKLSPNFTPDFDS